MFMFNLSDKLHNRPDVNIAHCGAYMSIGVPKNTPPDRAKNCKGFKPKQ